MIPTLTKQHLLKRLKKENLPHSYLSLMRWEKSGLIPKPKNYMQVGSKEWRIYTEPEIERIVYLLKKRHS